MSFGFRCAAILISAVSLVACHSINPDPMRSGEWRGVPIADGGHSGTRSRRSFRYTAPFPLVQSYEFYRSALRGEDGLDGRCTANSDGRRRCELYFYRGGRSALYEVLMRPQNEEETAVLFLLQAPSKDGR